MRLFKALTDGASGALKMWKGIVTVWFFLFLLAAVFVMPLRGVLNIGFGDSMVVERLADGIDVEVFADLGTLLSGIVSFFFSGLFLVILAGFLLNIFFAGGFFSRLKQSAGEFRISDFFRESARNFWSYLVITILVDLMIISLAVLIVIIPVSVVIQANPGTEDSGYKAGLICAGIFLLLLPLLILVADYARAWQASEEKPACFKAIGRGFSITFRTILRSWPMMVMLLIVQALFVILILYLIPAAKPSSGWGVFLLFWLSQGFFILKLLLKVWRYGSVTALMEQSLSPGPGIREEAPLLPEEPELLSSQLQDPVSG